MRPMRRGIPSVEMETMRLRLNGVEPMKTESGGPVKTLVTDPLDVDCADCLASEGVPCTTILGGQRQFHVARLRLAAAPDACGQCGAERGQPCYKTSGGIRTFPHRDRAAA